MTPPAVSGPSPAFRVERTYYAEDPGRVVAETDDWVEAQRLAVESRSPRDLVVRGMHPSHTWEQGRCTACGGWNNGSYGSQTPCDYDWPRRGSLVAAVRDEIAARGRARDSEAP